MEKSIYIKMIEEENEDLKKKVQIMSEALKSISMYGLSEPSAPAKEAIKALAEAEQI